MYRRCFVPLEAPAKGMDEWIKHSISYQQNGTVSFKVTKPIEWNHWLGSALISAAHLVGLRPDSREGLSICLWNGSIWFVTPTLTGWPHLSKTMARMPSKSCDTVFMLGNYRFVVSSISDRTCAAQARRWQNVVGPWRLDGSYNVVVCSWRTWVSFMQSYLSSNRVVDACTISFQLFSPSTLPWLWDRDADHAEDKALDVTLFFNSINYENDKSSS